MGPDNHLKASFGLRIFLSKPVHPHVFKEPKHSTPKNLGRLSYGPYTHLVKNAFLIFGYGVPRDICSDPNYTGYLDLAAKHIQKHSHPLVVVSGGPTDLFPPCLRKEGDEMKRFFKKGPLQKSTRDWTIVSENKSLSTLENLLFCFKKLRRFSPECESVTLFFEQSRSKRIKALAKKIFPKNIRLIFKPLTFGPEENGGEWLAAKEALELDFALWALASKKNLALHHGLYAERLQLLRDETKVSSELHDWWFSTVRSFLG